MKDSTIEKLAYDIKQAKDRGLPKPVVFLGAGASKAIELNPKDESSFYNWGTTLLELAKLRDDEEIYRECFEKLKQSADLGGGVYNLACAYAVTNDKENALYYLETVLTKRKCQLMVSEMTETGRDLKKTPTSRPYLKNTVKYPPSTSSTGSPRLSPCSSKV